MVFAFDGELATEVGVAAAVTFNTISYWIRFNESTGKNFFDGKFWTYNTAKGYAQNLPFLSESQVRRALAKLVEGGYLVTGCYNAVRYDRTLWYTFGSRGQEASDRSNKNRKPNLQIRDFDLTKSSNRTNDFDGPIPSKNHIDTIKEPIEREDADAPPPRSISKNEGQGACSPSIRSI